MPTLYRARPTQNQSSPSQLQPQLLTPNSKHIRRPQAKLRSHLGTHAFSSHLQTTSHLKRELCRPERRYPIPPSFILPSNYFPPSKCKPIAKSHIPNLASVGNNFLAHATPTSRCLLLLISPKRARCAGVAVSMNQGGWAGQSKRNQPCGPCCGLRDGRHGLGQRSARFDSLQGHGWEVWRICGVMLWSGNGDACGLFRDCHVMFVVGL